MAFNVVLGPDAKVDIWTLPFRVVTGQLNDKADVNESTDTESEFASKEYHQDGYVDLDIDLEVQLDVEANPTVKLFIAPFYLAPGGIVYLRIWPEGRDVSNSNWDIKAVVKNVSPGFNVRGSVPQSGRISCVSTGYYKRPYENLLQNVEEAATDAFEAPIRTT